MGGRRRTSGDGEGRDILLTFYNVLDYVLCELYVDAMDGGRYGRWTVGGGRWRVSMTQQTDVTQTVKVDVHDVPW